MSQTERFTSPYDIRLAIHGFQNIIANGTPLEEALRLLEKEPNLEIREIVRVTLLNPGEKRSSTLDRGPGELF